MIKPLFSVVIPIYNMEKLLSRCLDSLLTQSYPNLEIILVNDGSTDMSPQLCDQYAQKDSRIRVVHKKNAGVSLARNSALDIASGDYISFVDPDDWIEPNMYETLSKRIEKDKVDVVKFNALKGDKVLNPPHFSGIFYNKELIEKIVLPMIGAKVYGDSFLMGTPWMYLFKRELIEKHHICFDANLRRCEDRLFCITAIINAHSISYIDDALYHYETVNTSLSNRYDPIRWEQEIYYMEKLQVLYKQKLSPELITDANERLKNDYILRAFIAIDNLFFSDNSNSAKEKYKRTKKILSHLKQLTKSHKPQTVKMNLNHRIILFAIVHNQPGFLTNYHLVIGKMRKMMGKA